MLFALMFRPARVLRSIGWRPDARVRVAAIHALEALADPHLRDIANELVKTETDAAVAIRIRDVRFSRQRIEPDTLKYRELYEATCV